MDLPQFALHLKDLIFSFLSMARTSRSILSGRTVSESKILYLIALFLSCIISSYSDKFTTDGDIEQWLSLSLSLVTTISTEFNLTNPFHYTWSNGETRGNGEAKLAATSHANWRYIGYSSAVSTAGEHWISICRVVFVIVSLIILCTPFLRYAVSRNMEGLPIYTRHDRPHRIEDLSYKIIEERFWRTAVRNVIVVDRVRDQRETNRYKR